MISRCQRPLPTYYVDNTTIKIKYYKQLTFCVILARSNNMRKIFELNYNKLFPHCPSSPKLTYSSQANKCLRRFSIFFCFRNVLK